MAAPQELAPKREISPMERFLDVLLGRDESEESYRLKPKGVFWAFTVEKAMDRVRGTIAGEDALNWALDPKNYKRVSWMLKPFYFNEDSFFHFVMKDGKIVFLRDTGSSFELIETTRDEPWDPDDRFVTVR